MDTKPVFPCNYLEGLSNDLAESVTKILERHQLPPEVSEAVNTAIYLQVLANTTPESFHLDGLVGWNREAVAAASHAAWLLQAV